MYNMYMQGHTRTCPLLHTVHSNSVPAVLDSERGDVGMRPAPTRAYIHTCIYVHVCKCNSNKTVKLCEYCMVVFCTHSKKFSLSIIDAMLHLNTIIHTYT